MDQLSERFLHCAVWHPPLEWKKEKKLSIDVCTERRLCVNIFALLYRDEQHTPMSCHHQQTASSKTLASVPLFLDISLLVPRLCLLSSQALFTFRFRLADRRVYYTLACVSYSLIYGQRVFFSFISFVFFEFF
jgi:hypothetical protein